MKHLKIPGVAVMAAAALMAFAGSASAAVLTSPAGTAASGSLSMTTSSSLLLEGSVINDTCVESTMSAQIEVNSETMAAGQIATLSFSNCDTTVDVIANGSLEVNSSGEVITKGTRVTYADFGLTCIYGGGTGTKIGTLSGGTTAFINVSATLAKQSGSSALCSNTNRWFGQYKVTTPDTLLVN